MKLSVILTLLVAFCATPLFAQNQTTEGTNELSSEVKELIRKPLNGFAGISFIIGNPQKGEFQQSLGNNSLGFSICGGYYFDPIPVTLGAEVDFLFFGGEEKILPRKISGFNIQDTLKTSTTMIPVLLTTRLQPKIGHHVMPYLELCGGVSFYSSTSELKNYPNQSLSNSESAGIWMYGVGIGTQIRLVDFVELPSTHSALLLDIRARYLFGSEKTLKKASINNNNEAEFSSFTAGTDILTTYFGVTWLF